MRILLILGLTILSPHFLFANPDKSVVEERLVPLGHGISGEEIYVNSLKISPDFKHIGYVSRIGGTFRVWLDGISEKSHSGVTMQSPFFSPNQNRLAYVANEGDTMFVVLDNQEHKRFKNVGTITFSPDGSRLAYRAEDADGRHMVVIDGKSGPMFDVDITEETGIVFSPDSQHVAYVGINKNNSYIFVKDNKIMRSFEKIGQIKFSPDAKHVAYTAMKNGSWMVVLDDKKGAEYNLVNDVMFSPDSSQLAYTAQKNSRRIIVKNKKEISGRIGAFFPVFSPEGSRFAYLAFEKKNKFRYVIDDKQELLIDKPGRIIFSNDEHSTAYAAQINDKWHIIKDGVAGPAFKKIYAFSFSPTTNDILYAADNDDDKPCVVFNNTPGPYYSSIGVPVYSPDGKKYAYVASHNKQEMFMVISNKEAQTPYPIIGFPMEKSGEAGLSGQQPFFSPKGSRMAYPVYNPDKEEAFMVVDGKAQPAFDLIMQPCFSSDEKHIAYMAKKGDVWHMVVNGQASSQTCDGMIRGATIAFDSSGRCFFMLVANKTDSGLSFYRLEAEIKDPA